MRLMKALQNKQVFSGTVVPSRKLSDILNWGCNPELHAYCSINSPICNTRRGKQCTRAVFFTPRHFNQAFSVLKASLFSKYITFSRCMVCHQQKYFWIFHCLGIFQLQLAMFLQIWGHRWERYLLLQDSEVG